MEREHLESRPPEELNFAAGDYVLVGHPDSCFAGLAKPPTKLLPYRKAPIKKISPRMIQPFCIWFPKRQIQIRYLAYIHSTTALVKSITDKIASRDSDELAIEAVVQNDQLSI